MSVLLSSGTRGGREVCGLGRVVCTFAVVVCAVMLACGFVASAWASAGGAGWELWAHSAPTYLPPGGKGTIVLDVFNVGEEASSGPVTVTDTLPAGVTATDAGGLLSVPNPLAIIDHGQWSCAGNGAGGAVAGASVVTCTSLFGEFDGGGGTPTIDYPFYAHLQPMVAIAVEAGGEASGLVNRASIAGGGALAPASTQDPIVISSKAPPFAFEGWDGWSSNADGTLDTQAGSHPYETTFVYDLPTKSVGGETLVPAGGEPRDLEVRLPPGLVVNPLAVPQCSDEQFTAERCPATSQVGVIETAIAGAFTLGFPIYNLVPPSGLPAQFGFEIEGIRTFLNGALRSGSDYGLNANIERVPEKGVVEAITTLWNVASDPSHNRWRGGQVGGCSREQEQEPLWKCGSVGPPLTQPFLTLSTKCGAVPPTGIHADTWLSANITADAQFDFHDSSENTSQITGCEHLSFEPVLGIVPDTARVDTPAGVSVDVRPQLAGFEEAEGLSSSDIKDATVTLPEGLVVNPGQAAGLQVCGEAEDGLTTQAEKEKGEENNGPASCPAASRIGSTVLKTPLVEGAEERQLEGGVYLLPSNPPDIRLLLAASGDGVNVKLVGTGHLDGATGRVTATFADTPQAPVSDVKLSFNGGAHATLITPRTCGTFAASSDFTPWSTPSIPDATPSAQFTLSEGIGGGGCPGVAPFAPSMVAGMTNNQAGGFSSLSATFSRGDAEQDASSISVKTPPGLLAMIGSVERCPEPQAAQGTCGAGSLIGHTTVAVGAGPDPFVVQGGRVYLTGPYKGAPFGLTVVVPAVAGPFDLGNVVVRAAIYIDPHSAQPTIVSDPLPSILDGVPLQLKTVNVTIDRERFMFNPTNCEPLAATGTITSTQGTQAPVSTRFQAADCTALAFKPSFKVSTQAKTSKKNGASLTVKVGYPKGAEANIRSVAVTLPKQLPSRLTTIQQACPGATFAANPASCPVGSVIGTALASTPVLASAVTGPVYLVSHGGAAFPDLVLILQGEGITLDLVGSINIKKGVTSSTFASVPDAPISSFQLKLPEGPHSGLAAVVSAKAKGNLCGQSLVMPTTITGQNGAQIKQNTKIAVTGCPKATRRAHGKKKATRRAHGKHKTKKSKRKG